MQAIPGSIHHWQPQNSYRQRRIVLHCLFNGHFVVLLIEPLKNVLQCLDRGGWINLAVPANLRDFRQRERLERPRFSSMEDTCSAINIHTAEHDRTSRKAAKDIHELLGLNSRAQYQVDNDVRCESPEIREVVGKASSVADDLFRISDWTLATMEDAHPMTKRLKFRTDIRTDKSRCANQQNPHLPRPLKRRFV